MNADALDEIENTGHSLVEATFVLKDAMQNAREIEIARQEAMELEKIDQEIQDALL